MNTLPFTLRVPGRESMTLAEVTDTAFRFHGWLRIEPDGLWIEWSGTATVEKVGLTGVQTDSLALPGEWLLLPWGRLFSIDYRRLWRPHVELTGNDPDALRIVPGEDRGRLRCYVGWRGRRAAAEFVAAAKAAQRAAPALPGDWDTPRSSALTRGES